MQSVIFLALPCHSILRIAGLDCIFLANCCAKRQGNFPGFAAELWLLLSRLTLFRQVNPEATRAPHVWHQLAELSPNYPLHSEPRDDWAWNPRNFMTQSMLAETWTLESAKPYGSAASTKNNTQIPGKLPRLLQFKPNSLILRPSRG